jgi:L-serine dehydratase
MRNFSVFDIVGPIMIGPSSSHTAGAARLAKVAAIIAGNDIKKVEFLLCTDPSPKPTKVMN